MNKIENTVNAQRWERTLDYLYHEQARLEDELKSTNAKIKQAIEMILKHSNSKET